MGVLGIKIGNVEVFLKENKRKCRIFLDCDRQRRKLSSHVHIEIVLSKLILIK